LTLKLNFLKLEGIGTIWTAKEFCALSILADVMRFVQEENKS
jgi:hypothetical protein